MTSPAVRRRANVRRPGKCHEVDRHRASLSIAAATQVPAQAYVSRVVATRAADGKTGTVGIVFTAPTRLTVATLVPEVADSDGDGDGNGDGAEVSLDVPSAGCVTGVLLTVDAGAGTHVVEWHGLAQDGHAVTCAFEFTLP